MRNTFLNPYKIKHAIFVNDRNELNFSKSEHGADEEDLLNRIKNKKGKYYIITDKQFGLIQNHCKIGSFDNHQLTPNNTLSVAIRN